MQPSSASVIGEAGKITDVDEKSTRYDTENFDRHFLRSMRMRKQQFCSHPVPYVLENVLQGKHGNIIWCNFITKRP
jgi:hypothetical protein